MIKPGKMIKILLVEDDAASAYVTQGGLELTGEYEVIWAKDGEEGWAFFQKDNPDVVVTDIGLPRMNGHELVRKIREADRTTIVIIESGRTKPQDVVSGFVEGIDDYIRKPFVVEELHQRIRAIMKRSQERGPSPALQTETGNRLVTLGRYVFDPENKTLSQHHRVTQKLTPREAQLLLLLYENRNRQVSRRDILQRFWPEDDPLFASRSLDVFVSKLRKYLSEEKSVKIVNERGKGLQLVKG